MAFQAGSQVRPELGRIDYSGYTRAAEMQAQNLANIGSMIGGAIAAKKAKKQEAALTDAQAATMFQLAQGLGLSSQLGMESIDDAKIAVKSLGPKMTMDLIEMVSGQVAGPDTTAPADVLRIPEVLAEMDLKITSTGEVKEDDFGGKVLPVSDPRVQNLLRVRGADELIFGYGDLEFLGTEQ